MRKGITNSGQTMLARSLNGETLSFTGIKIGTGILPESTDLLGLTALINPCLSISTIKVYRPSDRNPGLASNQIVIQAQYNNQTFTEAKAITEYGIYAKIGEEEEKLYAYINASELPDNIAAYSSETYVTKVRDFTLTVGNGTTVQVKVDLSSVYPTMQDFNEGLALKIDKESISTDNTFATTSDTQVPSTKAVKEYTTEKLNELTNNSPEALNTLKELAAALGDDANFATTVTNAIANKADISKKIVGLKTTRENNLFFLDSTTTAGALKIILPKRKTNCFYAFDVEILNTINNKNTKLQINGFNRAEGCNYDDSTYKASAFHKAFKLHGEYTPSVSFYTGATEDYVLLGDISSSFKNCRIMINNVKVSNQDEDWGTFTINLLTSLESSLNSTQYMKLTNNATVGTGGTFSTITEAINYLYSNKPLGKAVITLLAGFVMQEQVYLSSGDYSWIQIDSIDSEVVIDRTYIQTLNETYYSAFTFANSCKAPIFNVLFNMNSLGNANYQNGVYLFQNSYLKILPGKGFKNSTGRNALIHKLSDLIAQQTIWVGGGGGSVGSVGIHDCCRADLYGASITGSSYHGLQISGSSNVLASSLTSKNNIQANVIVDFGSIVCLNSSDLTGTTQAYGLLCQRGSHVEASNSGAYGNNAGYTVANGGIINAVGSTGTKSQTVNTLTGNGIIFG